MIQDEERIGEAVENDLPRFGKGARLVAPLRPQLPERGDSGQEAPCRGRPLQLRRRRVGIGQHPLRVIDHKVEVGKAREDQDRHDDQNRAGGHHKTLVSDQFAGPANIVHEEYQIERVRVSALDQLIVDLGLPLPEHMKIDIDGSEVLFLRGATKTLANARLRSLMFELYEESPYYGGIVEQLSDCGFLLTAKHAIEQPWPGCEQLFNCEFWK